MATLKDRLEEFKKRFEPGARPYNAPREAIAAMHRATDELKASGIDNVVLKVGGGGPDFSLYNQDHVNADYTIRPRSRFLFDCGWIFARDG
jgi:hypothetical protein